MWGEKFLNVLLHYRRYLAFLSGRKFRRGTPCENYAHKRGSFDGENSGHATNARLPSFIASGTRILITILSRSNLFFLAADLFNGDATTVRLSAFSLLLFRIRFAVGCCSVSFLN